MNFLVVLKELLNVKELDYWQVSMLISQFNPLAVIVCIVLQTDIHELSKSFKRIIKC